MNDTYTGNYVRLVKLIRQTRRTLLDVRPGGLFVEMALYDACVNLEVSKAGLTIGYVTALEAVADYLDDRVSWGRTLPDPTMPGHTLTFRATDKQWEAARDKFRPPPPRRARRTTRRMPARRRWPSGTCSADRINPDLHGDRLPTPLPRTRPGVRSA